MMAFSNPYSPVNTQVQLPHTGPIVGGLTEGKQIQIQGILQDHAQANGFSVNLCCGPKMEPDCALHFNPRLNQGCIVRNTMIGGAWGGEEREGGMPIAKGKVFEIIIMATSSAYQVAVNGVHFTSFKHRIPMERVQYLIVDGHYLKINFIKYEGGMNAVPAPAGMAPGYNQPPGYGFAPGPVPPPYTYSPGGFAQPHAVAKPPARAGGGDVLYNPQIPLMQKIPGKMQPNKMIYISGVPHPGAKRFSINLLTAPHGESDYSFHFDVRINYGGVQKVVVRNTRKQGAWGDEECKVPHFPFAPSANFDMIIMATQNSFKVAVNNAHFIEYAYRMPLKHIDTLNIDGDVRIHSLRFQ
ncbi:galectin-4-like [Littorina saxatilis]|uniref:Galectin n=1 Tax=Littorina saxatilis TaxID=31220 RepID=A0AAN9GCN0_9CAEN